MHGNVQEMSKTIKIDLVFGGAGFIVKYFGVASEES